MKNQLLIFCIAILFQFSCSSVNKPKSKNDKFSIHIESIGDFKTNSDYNLNFTVKNDSKEEIFIPLPIEEYESMFSYFPEFLSLRFGNLGCDQSIDIPDSKGKKIKDFKKLNPGEKISLKINPSVFMGTFCEKNGIGPYTVQIRYLPNKQILDANLINSKFNKIDDKNLLNVILSKIPVDTIYSNIFEITQIK
jgi:hypothetical protein